MIDDCGGSNASPACDVGMHHMTESYRDSRPARSFPPTLLRDMPEISLCCFVQGNMSPFSVTIDSSKFADEAPHYFDFQLGIESQNQ